LDTLYVIASEEAAGKTTICAGLARHLADNGKKVGFVKLTSDGDNRDAVFMKQILNLTEDAASLGMADGDAPKVKEVYNRIAQGKDAVLVEGRWNKSSVEIARALNASVIMLETYAQAPLSAPGNYREFSANLVGVVINKVPVSQLQRVRDEASASAGKAGISILGVIPEDRALSSVTVGELAECTGGRILNNTEKAAELVENYLLGAMVVDSGLLYFGRKNNKAAIIRGNRPDMQLAALETSTRCLLLSGSSEPPMYNVQQKAESKGIPIILTERDTNSVVAAVEDALGKTRFSQEKKLSRLSEILQRHLNLQAIT